MQQGDGEDGSVEHHLTMCWVESPEENVISDLGGGGCVLSKILLGCQSGVKVLHVTFLFVWFC